MVVLVQAWFKFEVWVVHSGSTSMVQVYSSTYSRFDTTRIRVPHSLAVVSCVAVAQQLNLRSNKIHMPTNTHNP